MKQIAFIAIIALALHAAESVAAADEIAPTRSETPPITIHLDAQHPLDVIAEISKRSGVLIEVYPETIWQQFQPNTGSGPPTSIDLNIDNGSFWQVMQQVCEAVKMNPRQVYSARVLSLEYSPGNGIFQKRPASVGAQATFIAQSLQRHHTVELAQENPQSQKTCGINLSALIDPRLHVLKYQPELIIESAVDENGNSIASTAKQTESSQELRTPWRVENLLAPLDYDPQTSKKLASIKGSLRVTTATEISALDLDLTSANGVSKEVPGRTIHIDEVKIAKNDVFVRLTVTRTDMAKEQFRQQFDNLYDNIDLRSADGKRHNSGGGGNSGDDSITFSVQSSFQKDEERPVKLVWEIPTKLEDIDLPFEFKDLPLP